jgi:hypothetical protein
VAEPQIDTTASAEFVVAESDLVSDLVLGPEDAFPRCSRPPAWSL